MIVYEDKTKAELVAKFPELKVLSMLNWDQAVYSKENAQVSVPIKSDGSDSMFDVLVAASADFGTDFNEICGDSIELCIDIANAECFLYVDDGIENDMWGYVELSNEEFFEIMNRVYEQIKRR